MPLNPPIDPEELKRYLQELKVNRIGPPAINKQGMELNPLTGYPDLESNKPPYVPFQWYDPNTFKAGPSDADLRGMPPMERPSLPPREQIDAILGNPELGKPIQSGVQTPRSNFNQPAFMEGLRNISEGLGAVGTGIERGSLMKAGLSPNLAQPFVAEGIRKRIEDEEDYVSPTEQKVLGIGPGVRRSTLRMVSPYLGMPLRKEALDFNRQRETRIAGQADVRLNRLQPQAWKEVHGTLMGLNAIKRVREAFRDLKNYTGPITGRIQQAMIKLGAGEGEVAALNANTVDALAQYVRSISGAQVHVSEFERLKSVYPNLAQNPEQFEALLDNMEAVLSDRYNMVLDLEQSQQKDVGETRGLINKTAPGQPGTTPAQPTAQPAGTGKTIRMIDSTGEYNIPENLRNEFLKDHPNAVQR